MQPPSYNDGLHKPGPGYINEPVDTDGNTYLHLLCNRGAPLADIREAVEKRGADPNVLNKKNFPVLGVAIQKSSPEVVAYLIDKGADVHFAFEKDKFFNATFCAVQTGREEMLHTVLKHGGAAHVNKGGVNENGFFDDTPPLHAAIQKSYYKLMGPLVLAGADVNAVGGYRKLTPLQMTADNEATGPMAQLLLLGADIDAKSTQDKVSALHFAARSNRLRALEFLLRKGADVEAVDARGRTALMAAAEEGHHQVLKLLLPYVRDIDRRQAGEKHATALMKAAYKGDAPSVEALLKAGANPMLSDDFNKTAAKYAEESPANNQNNYRHYDYGYNGGSTISRATTLLRDAEEKAAQAFFEKKYKNHRP